MEVVADIDGNIREITSPMEVLEASWKQMEVGGSRLKTN